MKRLLAGMTVVVLMSLVYISGYAGQEANQREAVSVQNSKGEYVGTITDALMDSNGTIQFVILSIETGQDARKVAVPTASFSLSKEGKILLDISKEKLAAAPVFKISDLADPTFAERMYRFFGVMPSWSEDTEGVDI